MSNNSSVDSVPSRRRRQRTHDSYYNTQKRLLGLGSVVLGRIRVDCEAGSLEVFRLYSGLHENDEFLIYKSGGGEGSEECYCLFYLTEGAELIYESTTLDLDGLKTTRIKMLSPEDFLKINPIAVEQLYEDLMTDGFWDRIAFKHSRRGKPGYNNIWNTRT